MKTASAVLLALGLVSAHNNVDSVRIDVFHPMNFMKIDMAKSLVKSVTDEKALNAGTVTWAQCDDAAKVFTFDESSTTYSPDPIVKGSDISLNLAGIVSAPIEVTNVHVHVDWNGSTLYDQDLKQDNKYDSSYAYSVKWSVPSYAPSGHYKATLKGTGTPDKGGDHSVLCVTADFDF